MFGLLIAFIAVVSVTRLPQLASSMQGITRCILLLLIYRLLESRDDDELPLFHNAFALTSFCKRRSIYLQLCTVSELSNAEGHYIPVNQITKGKKVNVVYGC